MDKNAIKKYAIWAREELIKRVSKKAEEYGIAENNIVDENATNIGDTVFSGAEIKQRKELIAKIKSKGYEYVIEEVAYTWFNRFSAIRFMEVNNYLPSRIRVFTDEENNFKPQILDEAIRLELDGLNMEKVLELKDQNKTDELYKYLLITQCNALSTVLPGMFQKINDYTELLFPDNILREGSVVEQMISLIPEEDWQDAVQIIGWLYQYYNSVPKDTVFANLKKNIKIKKEDIPAATQLFTPDWIVRYMVENSLGRLWTEGHPNEDLKSNWKYYLEEAEQEDAVKAELDAIRKEYANMKPEDIKCIDPCMGSGHILVYMFDVLMQIYESYGYGSREAVESILTNNIYGLDIDERAAQLSYFAIMMKGREYDRRFFGRNIQPNVYAICESNDIDKTSTKYFLDNNPSIATEINSILKEMKDATEYGSLVNVTNVNFDKVFDYFNNINLYELSSAKELLPLVKVANILAQKYDVVITNPPYMGSSGAGAKLSEYVKKNYPDSKSDLFAVFIERCTELLNKNGLQAMITQHAFMFLSSYEKLRSKLLLTDIINMAHLGARAFEEIGGEVVQTTSWIQRKSYIKEYKGIYARLVEPTSQQGKEDLFLEKTNMHIAMQENFSKIPGSPIAYWVSENFIKAFEKGIKLDNIAEIVTGISTGDNSKYLRRWTEVDFCKISIYSNKMSEIDLTCKKWIPYNKGGEAKKWYGNNDYIVKWSESSHFHRPRPTFSYLYLKEGLTWSFVTSGMFSARYYPDGFLWDVAGSPCVIKDRELLFYVLGFLSTKIANSILKMINPTINCQVDDIQRTPLLVDNENKNITKIISEQNITLSKTDWDSFETSWDFEKHPLIKSGSIETAFESWENQCKERFNTLKANEEELNRIFIDIYGLQDELTPEVEDKDVTVRLADKTRDIKSFISYAVGCMFGRYSLDVEGLVYAGGDFDKGKYISYPADADNIIPICDDEYFDDDIVGKFVEFVKVVYGSDTLDENLKFIADALGGKGNPKEVIRNYFMNNFFADHCKIYQKRPIYWLFDSGKSGGFKALIYMHRYQGDTIARIRTDYVHEQQGRYRTAIADLERRVQGANASEKVKLTKELSKLKDQEIELRGYEEKVHHLADQMITIDLDDGVKNNYEIFKDVLAKIK